MFDNGMVHGRIKTMTIRFTIKMRNNRLAQSTSFGGSYCHTESSRFRFGNRTESVLCTEVG